MRHDDLARTIVRAINRTYLTGSDLVRQSGVSWETIDKIKNGKRVRRECLEKLMPVLGIREVDGVVEWIN